MNNFRAQYQFSVDDLAKHLACKPANPANKRPLMCDGRLAGMWCQMTLRKLLQCPRQSTLFDTWRTCSQNAQKIE